MSGAPSADRLGELVNFSVDAIVLVNADGVIQWANPATEDVLGYRADDVVGVHVRDLVEPADRDAWQALVAGLFDDPSVPVRGTFRCRHKDGSACWTEGVARNLLQEPRVGAIVVYYRDVSARKATEATAERHGGPLRPPRVIGGRRDLRSGCGRILSLRQPADPEALRVRRTTK